MRATAEAVLDTPVDEVWRFVASVENLDRWVTGISQLEPPPDGQLKPGATLRKKPASGGKPREVTYSVTEFQPPRVFAFKSIASPQPLRWRLELEKMQELTRVRNTVDVGAPGPIDAVRFFLMWPLMRAGLKSGVKRDLERLRNALEEQDAKPEAPSSPQTS